VRSRCLGLSLTELMVATTLMATVTAGGLSAFSRAHAARRQAGELQQLHERAQYVFATLEPELQMAGYFGTGASPAPLPAAGIPESALRCGADPIRRLDLPLQVYPAWQLACEARGSGAMADSDVLVVRRISARPAVASQAGRAQWWLRATDPAAARLFWSGEAPDSPASGRDGELRDLIVRIYYVARASDGEATLPALRVKSLTSIAGAPAFIDTEVMNGIEDLQVELLPSPAAARYAHLRLRVRADAAGLQAAATPRTIEVERHFALRNARD